MKHDTNSSRSRAGVGEREPSRCGGERHPSGAASASAADPARAADPADGDAGPRADRERTPSTRHRVFRAGSVFVFTAAAALGATTCAPRAAAGQSAEPAPRASHPPLAGITCPTQEVTYAITANLRITETPMGAGDGVYTIGPGNLVLRVDDRGTRAELVGFELHERFAVNTKAVLWNGTVLTDASVRATPDASGVIGGGALGNGVLRWSGPIRGYRTDGALTCDGSLCGKFGAPPAGRSELHAPPAPVHFQPLRFSEGGASFQMPYALVSQSESPRQKTYIALAGRELRRACVQDAKSGATADSR